MDWDKQFASIVTETEANLAKAKQRLESARAVSTSLTALTGHQHTGARHAGLLPGSAVYMRTEPADVQVRDELSRIPLTPHSTLADVSKIASSSGGTPGWVLLLEDKVSRQNKMIEDLVQTIQELRAEKNEYWAQIKDIRESVATLHERVVERGVDLHTEAKMEQWRKMTEEELASLRRLVQQSTLDASKERKNSLASAGEQIQELRLKMRENKNVLRDEYDNVKKELERMKAKLITIEHTIAAVNEETVSFTKRQGALHENLTELADSSRSNYRELAALLKEKTHEISAQKEELRELRQKVRDLPAASPLGGSSDRKLVIDPSVPLRRKYENTGLSSSAHVSSSPSASDSSSCRRAALARPVPASRAPRLLSGSDRSMSDSHLSLGYVARKQQTCSVTRPHLPRMPRLGCDRRPNYSKPIVFVIFVWLAYVLFLCMIYKLAELAWFHVVDLWLPISETLLM